MPECEIELTLTRSRTLAVQTSFNSIQLNQTKNKKRAKLLQFRSILKGGSEQTWIKVEQQQVQNQGDYRSSPGSEGHVAAQ